MRTEKAPVIAFLLVTSVALLIYSNTFYSPFQFDDDRNIVQNTNLRDFSYFWPPSGNRYVGEISFVLNYQFNQLDVFGYHLVNITIHVLNGFLVWWLVFLTLKTPSMAGSRLSPYKEYMALAAALLFVAHPIQTQAVTYIVQRFTSLATLFYLLSLVMYIQARLLSANKGTVSSLPKESRSWFDSSTGSGLTTNGKGTIPFTLSLSKGCYLFALLSAVLAMKTKEISFTLPLILVLYEFIFLGDPERKSRGLDLPKRLVGLLPFLLTWVIIPLAFLRANTPSGDSVGDLEEAARETGSISREEYLLTQFRVLVTYVRLLFLPVNQNLDYDYPVSRSFDLPVFFSFLFLLMIFGAAVYLFYLSRQERRRGLRLPAFGIFWFFITLSVESSVIPIRDVIYEHRLYLPSVGVALAFVAGTFFLFEYARPKGSPFQAACLLILVTVIPLGIAAYNRNGVWTEEVRLWEDVVKKSPGKGRVHMALGGAYAKQGRAAEAYGEYRIASGLTPNDARIHLGLGLLYDKQGRLEEAYQEYLTASRLAPDYAQAHLNLGVSYDKQGRLNEAYREYSTALRLKPNYAQAHLNLGILYDNQGRLAEAHKEYVTTLKLEPDLPLAHLNLGILYARQRRLEDAAAEFRTALRLAPGDPKVYYNLGVLYATQGHLEMAHQEFMNALKFSPNDPMIHYNLGKVYRGRGMKESARRQFETALKLRPDFMAARQALQTL